MNTRIICAPAAPLTFLPQQEDILQDEVLYGMTVTVLGGESGFLYVETPYQYRGYLRKSDTAEAIYPADLTVTAPFGDVLTEPKVNSTLVLSVPRGAHLLSCGKAQDGWTPVRLIGRTETRFVKADRVTPRISPALPRNEDLFRMAVLKMADTYRGAPYRWGGKTMAGIDCSGFCSMCYLLNGVIIHRDASIKEGFPIRAIPLSAAKPADLLYFPGHIALYLGGGRFLHATAHDGDDGVVESSLNPADDGFRADLSRTLITAGTLF